MLAHSLRAQVQVLPFNQTYYLEIDKQINKSNSNIHSAVKPYYINSLQDTSIQKLIKHRDFSLYNCKKKPKSWFMRKLIYESFIIIDTSEFNVAIDPLLNLEFGKNTSNDSFKYINTRGFLIRGNIGKSFAFNTSFYENQALLPNYLSSFVETYEVVPGSGYAKEFKTNGFDYSMAAGSVIYSPSKHLTFQFGNDKNFIGCGYRSLLLSDNSYNYPFLKTTYVKNKIQIIHLLSSFSVINYKHTFESGFLKKFASFHFINYKPNKYIDIGLFEATLYQSKIADQSKPYQWHYINPIPILNTAIFGLDNSDNCSIGLNAKVQITKTFALYGQYFIDDIITKKSTASGRISDKSGWQSGLKYYDALGLNNLFLQVEFNSVRPYVYSHANSIQSYTHYNQSLAHPLNANFTEYVGVLNYRIKRFMLNAKINYATIGKDSINSNFGSDIFASNNSNVITQSKMLQGIKTNVINTDISVALLINQASNMNLSIGLYDRKEISDVTLNERFVYIAFRTSFSNLYFDF